VKQCRLAARLSSAPPTPPTEPHAAAVASSRALFGGRSPHADALGRVPTSYLPTGGLVDFLDARVDDPSAARRVRLPDDFPFAALVGHAVADLKLHRQDGGLCGFTLLLGAWLSRATSVAREADFRLILCPGPAPPPCLMRRTRWISHHTLGKAIR